MDGDEAPIPWRGVHHINMLTPDLDATIRFYQGVLGFRLVAASKDFAHHAFFDIGAGGTLHVFEWPHVKIANGPLDGRPTSQSPLQHICFRLPDHAALVALYARLKEAGVPVSQMHGKGNIHSFYFKDNNGMTLEAAEWEVDPTSLPVDYDDERFFSKRDRLPAIQELARNGHVSSVSSSREKQGSWPWIRRFSRPQSD